nr:MAG TPA: hypothetical protein [Caudoviricetes sp.]
MRNGPNRRRKPPKILIARTENAWYAIHNKGR